MTLDVIDPTCPDCGQAIRKDLLECPCKTFHCRIGRTYPKGEANGGESLYPNLPEVPREDSLELAYLWQ